MADKFPYVTAKDKVKFYQRRQFAKEEIEELRQVLGEEYQERTVEDYGGSLPNMLKDFRDAVERMTNLDENEFNELEALYESDEDDAESVSHASTLSSKASKKKSTTAAPTKKMPTVKPADEAAKYLALEDKRKRWSWFQSSNTCAEARQRFAEDWNVDSEAVKLSLQDRYRMFIKAGRLGPEQAVFLAYILFPQEELSPYMLADWMLRTEEKGLLEQHNWYMVEEQRNPQAFREVNGDKISKLSLPLLPVSAKLDVTNLSIIESATLAGGGSQRQQKAIFKQNQVQVLRGGGDAVWFPVYTTQNGEPYVDMTNISEWSEASDNKFSALQEQLNGIQNKLQQQLHTKRSEGCFKCGQQGHMAKDCRNHNGRANNSRPNNQHGNYGNNSQGNNVNSNYNPGHGNNNNNNPGNNYGYNNTNTNRNGNYNSHGRNGYARPSADPPDFSNVPSSGTVKQ